MIVGWSDARPINKQAVEYIRPLWVLTRAVTESLFASAGYKSTAAGAVRVRDHKGLLLP